MENKASVVVMAIIIAVVLVAIGGGIWYYTTLNRNNSKICQNLWWYDDEHATCQEPKQFCGTYMYQGLEVFETKANCEQNITLKDEITDWKTYKNEELGFELKYPTDWRVAEIKGGGAIGAGFGPKSKVEDTLFGVIIVSEIPTLGTKGANYEITKVDTVSFGGYPAKKVYTKNLSVGKEWARLYIEKNGSIFSIGQPTLNNSNFPFENKYNNIINQILSTFKFTK